MMRATLTAVSIALVAAAALTGCGGGGGADRPPEPPGEDATSEELLEFMEDYNAWLEDCGDINECAEAVEDDPRYDQFTDDEGGD